MTNEQAVIEFRLRLAELKRIYLDASETLVGHLQSGSDAQASMPDYLNCNQRALEYFNAMEQFVSDSGLLGSHRNETWAKSFAEDCLEVLKTVAKHHRALAAFSSKLGLPTRSSPSASAYSSMQGMVAEYVSRESWDSTRKEFESLQLPTKGFDNPIGPPQMNFDWKIVASLVVGVLFALTIFIASILVPDPTDTQFFVFRGLFALALAAIAAVVPGFINLRSKMGNKGNYVAIVAGGAIAVFVIVWLVNPPALVHALRQG